MRQLGQKSHVKWGSYNPCRVYRFWFFKIYAIYNVISGCLGSIDLRRTLLVMRNSSGRELRLFDPAVSEWGNPARCKVELTLP